MGRGPEHFVRNGVDETLRHNGHEVHTDVVEATSSFRTEIKTAFELHKLVAERVRSTAQQGAFPLVLSGNRNTSVGTMTGLDPYELGIIWFDGHAISTPRRRRPAVSRRYGARDRHRRLLEDDGGDDPRFPPDPGSERGSRRKPRYRSGGARTSAAV